MDEHEKLQPNDTLQPLHFRPMTIHDLEAVHEIERQSYDTPWSLQSFYQEITRNKVAQYVVAEYERIVVGYFGVWITTDEAHVTNVAVSPAYRGRKIGDRLLRQLLGLSWRMGARKATLEVRVTNLVAQHLYEKYGFRSVGVRKKYYNGVEDALIMWADLDETMTGGLQL